MGRLAQAYVEGELGVDGRIADVLRVGIPWPSEGPAPRPWTRSYQYTPENSAETATPVSRSPDWDAL